MTYSSYEFKGYLLKCPRCYYREACHHQGTPVHETCFMGFNRYISPNPLGSQSRVEDAVFTLLLPDAARVAVLRRVNHTLEEFARSRRSSIP